MGKASFGTPAPNNSRSYLELRLGYRVQELTLGGLSRETRRTLDLLADEIEGRVGRKAIIADSRNPVVGTRLVREWDGVEHTVTVDEGRLRLAGAQVQVAVQRVARAITGTQWNGYLLLRLARGPEGRPMSRHQEAVAVVSRRQRCAIYTRKSSEEGLEMEFNSLDAQREACEAFRDEPEGGRLGHHSRTLRRRRLLRWHAGAPRPEASHSGRRGRS